MLTICTTFFNNLTAFCSQSVYIGFIWFSELTAIILLSGINQYIFVTETRWVFFEVRVEFLNRLLFSWALLQRGVSL